MALRTVQPRKPVTPRPTAGGVRTARPATSASKPPVLSALTNLATISGGTPPGTGQPDQNAAAPWESDPVLQQIRGMQAANVAAAEAQAQAARQQALISYGYDPALEAQGVYGDAGTAGSAKANPFSTLSSLSQQHQQRQKNLNESLNKANLFYSSTRGTQLGQEGQQYLGEQYQAGQKLQSVLGQIAQGRLGAQQTAQGDITQGTQQAYDRWLNQQLQYGLGDTASGATMRTVHAAANRNLPNMRRNLISRRPV